MLFFRQHYSLFRNTFRHMELGQHWVGRAEADHNNPFMFQDEQHVQTTLQDGRSFYIRRGRSPLKTTENKRQIRQASAFCEYFFFAPFLKPHLSMLFQQKTLNFRPQNGLEKCAKNVLGKRHTCWSEITEELPHLECRFHCKMITSKDWIQQCPVMCARGNARCRLAFPSCQNGSAQPAKWQPAHRKPKK